LVPIHGAAFDCTEILFRMMKAKTAGCLRLFVQAPDDEHPEGILAADMVRASFATCS
jgi:hypothetical protein